MIDYIRRMLGLDWRPVEPLAPGDYWTEVAGNRVRASLLALHLIAVGLMRTGKSSLMEGLLRDAVRHGRRVLAVDYQGSLDFRLRAVVPPGSDYRVVRVDAATRDDPVGFAWKRLWASESRRLIFSQKVAPILPNSQNPFFDNNAQRCVIAGTGALYYFKPDRCSLANLIRLLDFPELLAVASEATPHVKNPFSNLGFKGRSARDVMATNDSKTYATRIFAALDERAPEKWDPLSLVDDGSGGEANVPHAACLVFRDLYAAATGPILGAIADIVGLEQIAEQGREMLVMSLDELTSLGRLEILAAIRRGSKALLALLMSAHSIEGVRALYGDSAADILNLPGWRCLFRQGSPESARWASEVCGAPEVLRRLAPEIHTHGEHPSQTEYKLDVTDRANVHVDQLRRAPLASWDDNTMTCFVDGPHWTRECRDVAYRHLVETQGEPPPRRPALPGAEELHAWKSPGEIHDKTGIPLTLINEAYKLRERNRKGGEREEEQGR